MKGKLTFPIIMAVMLGCVFGRPSDEESHSQETSVLHTAGEEDNSIKLPGDEFDGFHPEDFGRFTVTQAGTMMCFRNWEDNPKTDFHVCNVCFNNTNYPSSKVGKNDYIAQVDSCINTYLGDTDFKTCQPMLKDPTIPNKSYDILVSEPPFDFPYRNYVRCAHGVALNHEGRKCVDNTDVLEGTEAFLEKFSCLMKNLIIESRRFSEANLQELLRSVPQGPGGDESSPTFSTEE